METGPRSRARARSRSRVVWESRLWVQRFAIITFRACRFVCINSVRQFPLCGVHSRVRESPSLPLALLACPLARAVRSVPDEREAPWKQRITLMPRAYARARVEKNEGANERTDRSFPGRIRYPGIGKRSPAFPRSLFPSALARLLSQRPRILVNRARNRFYYRTVRTTMLCSMNCLFP